MSQKNPERVLTVILLQGGKAGEVPTEYVLLLQPENFSPDILIL